jgi:hypothetical protein
MKKIFIAVCSCILLAGCQNPEQQSNSETVPATEAVSTAAQSEALSTTSTATEPEEDVFVDHDGIRITSKGLGFSEKFAAIIIEINNQSAHDIVVQTRDFSVNGYMCKAALSQEVTAGKKAKANIRIFEDELAKNGMKKEDIRDVEFKINISTPDFMTEIYESDVINLHYEPS